MTFNKGYALIIGVGSHKYIPEADVLITVADAKAVAEVLQDTKTCGYIPKQIQLIHDQGATKEGLLAALDELGKRTGKDDTIFLYYCGHGALGTDGNYYLVSHDTEITSNKVAAGTGVSEGELLEKLKAIQVKRMLLIFNACFSGNISPSLDVGGQTLETSSLSEDTSSAILGTGSGRIIITACRESQKSYIGDGTLTIFTQALVDGLHGKGIGNNGGYISVFHLYEHIYEFVTETVQDLYNVQQEPELTVLKGVGPFAVALYKGASDLGEISPDHTVPKLPAVHEVKPQKAQRVLSQRIIQTGGGAYVGGNLNTGGGDFIGRDQIIYGNKVKGDKVGGDKITVGEISNTTSIAIGRRANAMVTMGTLGQEIDRVFTPLLELARAAPPDKREEAIHKAEELKAEAAKGRKADDSRVGKLIDGLVGLIPGAVSTVVSMFANPVLGSIVGPVTKFVLEKIQEK